MAAVLATWIAKIGHSGQAPFGWEGRKGIVVRAPCGAQAENALHVISRISPTTIHLTLVVHEHQHVWYVLRKTWHQGLNICSALYIFIIALAVFWHHNPWCTMCVSKVQQNKQLNISFPILYFSSFLQGKNRVVLEVQIEKIWTALNVCRKYFAQSSQLTTRAQVS